MKTRCDNPRTPSYRRYGAKGVTVCQAWYEYDNFEAWALSHGYRAGLTLDRRKNDQGYSPENCRWATTSEQARNRSSNRWLEAFGERLLLKDWAKHPCCVVRYYTLRTRMLRGWELSKALTTPSQPRPNLTPLQANA